MAKRSNADVAFLLVDGRSLLGYTTELSDEVESLMRDSGGLDQAWPVHTAVGAMRAAFTQNGWYDDATDATHETLSGQQGVRRVLCYAFNGNVVGRAFSMFAGIFGSKYRRVVQKDDLHRANADYTVTGAAEEGLIVHALGARTAAGNNQSLLLDFVGQTNFGAAVVLQVTHLTLGGHTALQVTMRHSNDNTTWVDMQAFTPRTNRGAERIAMPGAVFRYVSCSWTFTGAGSGPTATFMVGIDKKAAWNAI